MLGLWEGLKPLIEGPNGDCPASSLFHKRSTLVERFLKANFDVAVR